LTIAELRNFLIDEGFYIPTEMNPKVADAYRADARGISIRGIVDTTFDVEPPAPGRRELCFFSLALVRKGK
jgi:hypothetical protein